MLNLRDRGRGTITKESRPAGIYDSVVLSAEWDDNYGEQKAYVIQYEITSQVTGKVFRHSEIFLNKADNKRTVSFEDYLADNGIFDVADFVGVRELLTFAYVKKNDAEFFNIVSRQFCHDVE